MANKYFFQKDVLNFSHLPTFMLIVGYIAYWFELYVIKLRNGQTTFLATGIFLVLLLYFILRLNPENLKLLFEQWKNQGLFIKCCIVASLAIIIGIVVIAFYASFLPPHLLQEFDALNYHITLPRQHLILGSFKHINWSSADLFTLPVDFALAPYCLATELPNKIPQFLFLLGLVFVSLRITGRLSDNSFIAMLLVIFAIFGSHFLGIQMGTAMLDIVLAYLFLAALDSFMIGNTIRGAVEFTFFIWSKPFLSLQFIAIAFIMGLTIFISKKVGFKTMNWGFATEEIGWEEKKRLWNNSKQMLLPFILSSIIVAGPFLFKSTYYAGTPLYPFMPGVVNIGNINKDSAEWESLILASKEHLSTKDAYGYGRDIKDFIRFFWIFAVPDKDVNNKYDYPAGLPYLIFLVPFLYMLFYSIKQRQLPVMALFIVIYWLFWWFGSQQARFLYIPVLLMIVFVASQIKFPSRILMAVMVVSLITTGLSIFRAHKNDFGKSKLDVLRTEDKRIIELNKNYLMSGKTKISLDRYDLAYAQFPVMLKKEQMPWVLYTNAR